MKKLFGFLILLVVLASCNVRVVHQATKDSKIPVEVYQQLNDTTNTECYTKIISDKTMYLVKNHEVVDIIPLESDDIFGGVLLGMCILFVLGGLIRMLISN